MAMQSHALVVTAPRTLQWVEEELPPVGPNDVLVETSSGAISIGAELPEYRGDARSNAPATYPRMTGYESLGVVRARGTAVRQVQVGDRVAAFYGHRTHMVTPVDRVIPVPPDIRDELALLLILSGDVATGVRKLGPALREPVLITGAGAIGLLAIFVLTALGAPAVDVIEPQARRRTMATRLGARRVVAPEDSGTLTGGYGAGIECSSRNNAFMLLQDQVRHDGRICILADGNIEPLVLAPAFHDRELTVMGSSDCPDYHSHARWYFPVVRERGQGLEQLFDLHIANGELEETFERLAAGTTSAVKVLVRYDGGRQDG